MAYIALYWSAMVIGYYIGSKKRDHGDRFLKPTDVIMMASVSLLVFLMGIRMGSNEEVIRNLGTIGLQALLATVLLMAGAVLSVTVTRKLLHIDKWGRLEGHAIAKESAELEQYEKQEEEEEKSSNLMTWLILIFVVLGIFAGYFLVRVYIPDVDGFNDKAGIIMTCGLTLLLGVIGFQMGIAGTVVEQLKLIGFRVLIFPVAVLIGTAVVGALMSLILPLTLRESLAVSFGFGWYTFAPVAISNAGHVIASAVSFMHNVFREMGGIVLIPLLAKKIGYIEVTSLPGVAAMDIGLTLVEKATRPDIIVYSFAIGMSQSLLVPLLVPLVIGA
ncbi:lysine exporter LysO family protein [Emergencia timonensis]|uniref:lysine exporter LysO family protein n=1 Tax=Emergencia timonensis TaxID=1776384 RepID=UPI003992750D